jgi:hypothetical protein
MVAVQVDLVVAVMLVLAQVTQVLEMPIQEAAVAALVMVLQLATAVVVS